MRQERRRASRRSITTPYVGDESSRTYSLALLISLLTFTIPHTCPVACTGARACRATFTNVLLTDGLQALHHRCDVRPFQKAQQSATSCRSPGGLSVGQHSIGKRHPPAAAEAAEAAEKEKAASICFRMVKAIGPLPQPSPLYGWWPPLHSSYAVAPKA